VKRRATAVLLAALGLVSAPAAAAGDGPAPTVLLISMDGVRHDHPDRASFPALERMAREGARAARLVPVGPASTFPSHVSLATGAPPAVHGIVDNVFWDPARGDFDYSNDASWIEAEPLWAAAERQGVTAAAFFWVGSETDWRGVGASHRRRPFSSKLGEAEKVEQILAWLDLPAATRPRLVMSWWHGADHAGHRHGPDHPSVSEALAEQDRHLAALLEGIDARGLWPHTTLLVVSDHGMSTAGRTIPLRERLREAGLAPRVVLGSAVAHVFLDGEGERERAERVLDGLAGLHLHRRDAPAVAGLAHPTRSGDLVALAEPGYTFRRRRFGDALGPLFGRGPGLHGYALPHPDMPGVFFALGRCVPRGAHPESIDSLDVAATAAALLGIDAPAHSRGHPLDFLEPPCSSSSTSTAR